MDYQANYFAYVEQHKMLAKIPEVKLDNYAYRNKGGVEFEDVTQQWGLNTPSFSNGAAYGDLDNDGDLDLVVNNINDQAFLYKNTATSGNYLCIELTGKPNNREALGATIAYKSIGVDNVVVVDLIGSRLEKALEVGADAVVNAAGEDVAARLTELHGPGKAMWPGKAGTDIYLDCAGTPAVIDGALRAAQNGARLGVVAVHKEPVAIDLVNLMANEITVIGSMGYPTEIFEVTRDLAANWEKYAVIVSHTFGFDDVQEALVTARTPGAADKVVVTFD